MTSSRLNLILFKIFIIISLFIVLIFSYMYTTHDVRELKNKYPQILILNESSKFVFKPNEPKEWVRLDEISNYAKWAIILSEDWSFYQHKGIDFDQIKVALGEMINQNKFRGASTITQQMVKNLYLTRHRTFWRKIHEIILSQKVEKNLSKNRILEIYLNIIEFGPGIYGINKASYHYFGKAPSKLNPLEGAFLAMLLPSPNRYYISFRNKILTPFARNRVRLILAKLRMAKIISQKEYEQLEKSKLFWER